MAPGAARDAALDHLYRGQSNDCYWHGLFGGIYIAHMRAATLAHLIAAEDLADAAAGERVGQRAARPRPRRPRRGSAGRPTGQVVVVELDEGAGIGVVGPPGRPARAHRRAPPPPRGVPRDAPPPRAKRRRGEPRRACGGRGGPATRRRRSTNGSRSRRPGLADRLVYDDYERRSGLIRILPRTRPRPRGAPAAGASSATSSTGHSASSAWTPTRSASRATGRRRSMAGDSPLRRRGRASDRRRPPRPDARAAPDGREHAARRRSTRGSAASGRSRCSAAAATRRPGGSSAAGASSHDGTRSAANVDRLAQGNGWLGVGARDVDRARGRRVDRADRDDLELGGRLRARLPGQRAAPLVAGPARAGRALVSQHQARGDLAHDRATGDQPAIDSTPVA